MNTCDYCGEETEHAFQCNHCGQALCGDHRLPENHKCPFYSAGGEVSSFSGEGPDTTDRRGTGRKQSERIREKETSRMNPPSVDPQSKGDRRSEDTGNTSVLTCPTCNSDTARVFDCEECGLTVCPDCEDIYEHECPVGVTDDDETDESDASLVGRLLGLFR